MASLFGRHDKGELSSQCGRQEDLLKSFYLYLP